MQAVLIFLTLFLTAISDGFCGRLEKIQNAIKDTCPPPEEIPQCFCTRFFGTLDVNCHGPMTESQFESILKTLQEYSISNFKLSKYNASTISTDLWNGQNFKSIDLSEVEVEDFGSEGKRHFQGLENSLDTLHIYRSFKTVKLHSLQLDHLEKLTVATFQDNNIPKIGNEWFASGHKKLHHLIFINNGIEELGDAAFTSLSMLQFLRVSDGFINMISRTMLPKSATVLSFVDFSNNQIRALPNDIFSGMPALYTVYLDNNRIHTIEEDTLKSVAAHLRFIALNGNPLECDEKLKWMCNAKFMRAFDKNWVTCNSPPEYKHFNLKKYCEKESF